MKLNRLCIAILFITIFLFFLTSDLNSQEETDIAIIELNVEEEYILIKNEGSEAINLDGWILKDESEEYEYIFDDYILNGSHTLQLQSGTSMFRKEKLNTVDDYIIWSEDNVWDNDKDTAYLYNPDGRLVTKKTFDFLETDIDTDTETGENEVVEEDFDKVYEEEKEDIDYEDLTLIEQIQIGYYKGAVDKYIKQLKADKTTPANKSDASYALSRILQIEEDKRPVDVLITALESRPYNETTYIRRYAALALGYTNDPRAIKPLIKTMKRRSLGTYNNETIKEDVYVRIYACYSLGMMRATEAARDIVNILREEVEPRRLRRQAALSLGLILDENVYNRISDMLSSVQDSILKKNLIWTLGEYGKFGYEDASVLQELLRISYQDKPDIVINTYKTLENILGTDTNPKTDEIIDDTLAKLEKTISTPLYRNYLNTLYSADNIRIEDKAYELIKDFEAELIKIKEAGSSKTTLTYIEDFLSKIANPKNFTFPDNIIFLEEVDRMLLNMETKLEELEKIKLSYKKKEEISRLYDNAYKALSMIEDNEKAKQQAKVYNEAKLALERYEVDIEETVSVNEPLKYLDILKTKYIEAIKALNDFYYIYARREAVSSIGKIYLDTYDLYNNIYNKSQRAMNDAFNTYNSLIEDIKNVKSIKANIEGINYADVFVEQVNYDNILKHLNNFIENGEQSISVLKSLLMNYYLYPVHNPKEVIQQNISSKSIYKKDADYKKSNIETVAEISEIEKNITNVAAIYSKSNAFKNLRENEEIVEVVLIEDNIIIGKIINEFFETVSGEEKKKIIIKTYDSGDKEIFLEDIERIILYEIPEEFFNENIIVTTTSGELVGKLIKVDYDAEGKIIVIKTYDDTEKIAYMKNLERINQYTIPQELIGEKLIIKYGSDSTTKEIIGTLLRLEYGEGGKQLIIESSKGEESIYLRYVESIIIYTNISALSGQKVIVKLIKDYSDYNYDLEHIMIGEFIKESVDKIVINIAAMEENVYNKEYYYRTIYLKDIKEIIIDYTIPDILSIGTKSIEMEELINKFKYDKNSVMRIFDKASKSLVKVSVAQSKLPKLSDILGNAKTTLEYYSEGETATKFYNSIKKTINIIDSVKKNIDVVSQSLSNISDYIDDNIHSAYFDV
ncbi:MAG: lamin tail domain-containing protein, partial [Spirochaetota bacterium]